MTKRQHSPLSKTDLLPFPRAVREHELLECHLCLCLLRTGNSAIDHLIKIARILKISNLIAGDGYGMDPLPVLSAAQDSILKAQLMGRATGRWQATEDSLWRPLAAVLQLYEEQLERTPSFKVIRAFQRVNDEAREVGQQAAAPVSLAA